VTNFLALIGALAIAYAAFRVYQAYKDKLGALISSIRSAVTSRQEPSAPEQEGGK
jgi:hypothetical protein